MSGVTSSPCRKNFVPKITRSQKERDKKKETKRKFTGCHVIPPLKGISPRDSLFDSDECRPNPSNVSQNANEMITMNERWYQQIPYARETPSPKVNTKEWILLIEGILETTVIGINDTPVPSK